ncbi:hypothetical protein B0H10DRAFT_1955711 [Mycena sp. CBHHK59/15]|nr:hypothetical protein B0H10DRAFT_1955711 [Mycena sp. CBHHK59/15]
MGYQIGTQTCHKVWSAIICYTPSTSIQERLVFHDTEHIYVITNLCPRNMAQEVFIGGKVGPNMRKRQVIAIPQIILHSRCKQKDGVSGLQKRKRPELSVDFKVHGFQSHENRKGSKWFKKARGETRTFVLVSFTIHHIESTRGHPPIYMCRSFGYPNELKVWHLEHTFGLQQVDMDILEHTFGLQQLGVGQSRVQNYLPWWDADGKQRDMATPLNAAPVAARPSSMAEFHEENGDKINSVDLLRTHIYYLDVLPSIRILLVFRSPPKLDTGCREGRSARAEAKSTPSVGPPSGL